MQLNFVFVLSGAAANEKIIHNENKKQVESYRSKVGAIRDILCRDRMKVAFFGR